MWARSIQIKNYKGFQDTGRIVLDPHWNVVVGQNNSGKTAMVESFRFLNLNNRPHKNASFEKDHAYDPLTRVCVDLVVTPREEMVVARRQGAVIELPIPINLSPNPGGVSHFVKDYFAAEEHEFPIEFQGGGGRSPRRYPAHGLFSVGAGTCSVAVEIDPTYATNMRTPINNKNDNIVDMLGNDVGGYFYVFNAERYSLGACPVSDEVGLRPDAANLGAVLLNMTAQPALYQKYIANVSAIFPNIHWVSSVVVQQQQAEVRVSTNPIEKEREDLAVPLAQCGTGVGQVLAILYVAMTQPPGVIVIDEPNSFLHPGAAKKLMQILKRYDQHQYVISTHSPEVISAAQPARLHLVSSDGQASSVQSFDDTKIDNIRMMLEELGASLADVFGSERVIWVEGPTERVCFELIVANRFNGPIVGLSFISLRNTGDFERKGANTDAVLDIYNALSAGGSILPVTVAFSFDGEDRSQQQKDDLVRRCGGKAAILPRRMTENYLLDSRAIAVVLGELQGKTFDAASMQTLLEKHGASHLPRSTTAKVESPEFLKAVDGAKLLADVFHEATAGEQEYRKVRDAVELLRVLLADEPEVVEGLVGYVGGLVGVNAMRSDAVSVDVSA